MTRILIADDHDVVRSGVRAILEGQAGWEVVGEAEDGKAAIDQALTARPDVVVLDYALPLINGIEATRQIRARVPGAEVLIFTMHDTATLVREVLEAGARGFLLKSDAKPGRSHLKAKLRLWRANGSSYRLKLRNFGPLFAGVPTTERRMLRTLAAWPPYAIALDAKRFLVAAVESLAEHKPFFTSKVSEALLECYLSKGAAAGSVLTAREKAVVQLIAEGHTNRKIADVLSISLKTVETHRVSAMRKLNLDTTAALIRYAIRNKLVEA